MKLLAILSFVLYAMAARVNVHKRASPLDVKLQSVGNSAVKASFTNTGSTPLKIFKTGSVLDSASIEKAQIFSGCKSNISMIAAAHSKSTDSSPGVQSIPMANPDLEPLADKVAFDGVRLSVLRSGLNESSFQTLAAGETVETEWDPAEVHDLSAGGDFEFLVKGTFLTADADSNDVTGAVPFDSNSLVSHVEGAAAAKVRRSFHENLIAKVKRTNLQSDCTGANGNAQRTALTNCQKLATAAAEAASNGSSAKVSEYFMSSSQDTRTTVAGVFKKIATECGSTTSGTAEQYCTDTLDSCESQVLAYTVPSQSIMVSCPRKCPFPHVDFFST